MASNLCPVAKLGAQKSISGNTTPHYHFGRITYNSTMCSPGLHIIDMTAFINRDLISHTYVTYLGVMRFNIMRVVKTITKVL